MSQLTVNSLTCQYDTQVIIDDLSFTLNENEIVALLGPSGCGKTTLLKALAGLLPVSKGQIHIANTLVSDANFTLASEKRKIAMIFQDYALFPHLNVAKNIAFAITKLSKLEQNNRVKEMLNLVNLSEFATRYPHELSGGQQQRVAIARALAYQPKIVLLDEPFSNIDSQSRVAIMADIRNILKQQKVAAIFVTHSKDEAFVFADRLAIFATGKIAQQGTAQQVYSQPTSKYVANFLGQANYLTILSSNNQGVETAMGFIQSVDNFTLKGNKNTLMLRPEQIHLTADDNSPFKIHNRVFCGSYWRYEIASDNDNAFYLEVHSNQQLAINCSVKIQTKAHQLVLF